MTEPFEVWRNTGEGRVVVRRMNELGGYRHESVRGGGELHLSEQERRYNQSLSTAGQDPFSNSILVRVDGEEVAKRVDAGAGGDADTGSDAPSDVPALDRLTDERIDELLDWQWKRMGKAINGIDSAQAIRRILARAEDTGVSVKRLDMLRTRLREIAPNSPLPNRSTRALTVESDIADPQEVDIYNMGPTSAKDFVAGGRA